MVKDQTVMMFRDDGVSHVLIDLHILKDIDNLKRSCNAESDDFIRGKAIDSPIFEVNRPPGWRAEPCDQVEEGALPGPIRPDQGMPLPFEDFQAHIVNDVNLGQNVLKRCPVARQASWAGFSFRKIRFLTKCLNIPTSPLG